VIVVGGRKTKGRIERRQKEEEVGAQCVKRNHQDYHTHNQLLLILSLSLSLSHLLMAPPPYSSVILGFSYEIIESLDGFVGVQQPNGSWNGIMGALLRDEVDILYCDVSITSARAAVMEFTTPYFTTGG